MGVDDFETRYANRAAFQRLALRPKRLGPDVPKLDMAVSLFGKRWGTPLFLCPVAALEAYHTEGESGAARAAKARGILQIQSHQSSQSYEQIAEARGEPHWFQLYANQDWDVNRRTLDKVKAAGCPVLVWTVDLLGGSNRELSRRSQGRENYNRPLCQSCHNHKPGYERPMHRGVSGPPGPRPAFDWDYVKRLKDHTGMKIVVKGIVTREDAELAIQQGVDGVFVSNHGGRAENSLRGTIDSLPEVVAGVKGRVPVLVDSGVRRGADIFKALALGADAVGIGRPYVWGLGAFGQEGVDRVIAMLLAEFAMVMRQTRTATIDQIGPGFVAPGNTPIMMRDNRQGFGL
jgi:isopentenyl diphosphate isomerase/L-lactate dehydrogenase-like FMN-dependent dehydrogenase